MSLMVPGEEEEVIIPLTPIQELLAQLNPINTEDWGDMKIYEKVYEIFKVRRTSRDINC